MGGDAGDLHKLRWRARRGTRELDRLLGWWLDERHAQADAGQRAAFAALLEQQDPQLWDWLTGHGQPDDVSQARVIGEIRTHHRV